MDARRKTGIIPKLSSKKIIFGSFPLHCNEENFKEIIGTFEIINKENSKLNKIKSIGCLNRLSTKEMSIMPRSLLYCQFISGIETQKSAFAGVGNPLNEDFCSSSMLNFASLSAENTASINTL